jgi:hypothetical protein
MVDLKIKLLTLRIQPASAADRPAISEAEEEVKGNIFCIEKPLKDPPLDKLCCLLYTYTVSLQCKYREEEGDGET